MSSSFIPHPSSFLFDYPKSAAFGRVLPKNKIYEHAGPSSADLWKKINPQITQIYTDFNCVEFEAVKRRCYETETKISVKGIEITVLQNNKMDYISLTDIAKTKEGDSRAADIIKNWIRNRGTIEFIGTWEQLHNPNFKVVEFDHFRLNAGLTSFVLSPGKWVEKTDSIGTFVKGGKYGGTYAHKDIAFEFCSAISPIFKLYLIKEFQRLKEAELQQLGWDIRRNLTKINYRILRRRGGFVEHGPVRQDSKAVAR